MVSIKQNENNLMSKEIREMIDKVRNFNRNKMVFLGYHSSMRNMESGFHKGDILDIENYSDVIRYAYSTFISDFDKYIENDDIEHMNKVFKKGGYGFTFVSKEPLKGYYSIPNYKYGNYLYKVFGSGSEFLLDDINELYATIVISKKPLYFEKQTDLV